MNPLRALRSLFAWRIVRETPVYVYQENTVTGRRRAVRVVPGGYVPINEQWLEGGPWEAQRTPSRALLRAARIATASGDGDAP